MKKSFLLMILLMGFGVSQATVAEKHPPGKSCGFNPSTFEFNMNTEPDGSMLFNVVQSCAFNVVQVEPVFEFSYCYTQPISTEIVMPIERRTDFDRWYPLAAGGVAYGYSNGPVMKLNNFDWESGMRLIYSQDKILPPAKIQEVWLLNCNIRLSNIWG